MKGKMDEEMNAKTKYFSSGFMFIAKALEKYYSDEFEFTYKYAPATKTEILDNMRLIKGMIKSGEMEDYDVVHLGNWETILSYRKTRKDQVFIAHAHGFFVGINFDRTIVELPFVKRQLSRIHKLVNDRRMREQLKRADIFYCSTPNMLEHCLKIRPDAIWLPNPIDTSIFCPVGEKVSLEGNPSVFLPTRIHVFKNPVFGAQIFKKIRDKHPGAKLHIVKYASGEDPLYNAFMNTIGDKSCLVVHDKMSREELAKFYRSADLVLGQFNPNLGNMSLVELEAMACGAPVVTLDKYERHYALDELEGIAFRLIDDAKFRAKYVKDNIEYVERTHSERAVADMHRRNLMDFMKNR